MSHYHTGDFPDEGRGPKLLSIMVDSIELIDPRRPPTRFDETDQQQVRLHMKHR